MHTLRGSVALWLFFHMYSWWHYINPSPLFSCPISSPNPQPSAFSNFWSWSKCSNEIILIEVAVALWSGYVQWVIHEEPSWFGFQWEMTLLGCVCVCVSVCLCALWTCTCSANPALAGPIVHQMTACMSESVYGLIWLLLCSSVGRGHE